MRKTLSVALSALLTAIGVFALPQKAGAFAKKPKNTVRFFVEVGSISKDPFSLPVTLTNPTRHSFTFRADP